MKKLFSLIFLLTFFNFPEKVLSAEEFLDLQCMSDIKSKYPCNVSFYRKFMKLNYPRSGRSNKVRYENIIHWNYSDSSQRKMDVGPLSDLAIAISSRPPCRFASTLGRPVMGWRVPSARLILYSLPLRSVTKTTDSSRKSMPHG